MKNQKRSGVALLILAFGFIGSVSAEESRQLEQSADLDSNEVAVKTNEDDFDITPYEILDPTDEDEDDIRTCRVFSREELLDGDSWNPNPEYGENIYDLNDWKTLCALWNTSEAIDLLDRVFTLRTHLRKEQEWDEEVFETIKRLWNENDATLMGEERDTLVDIARDIQANLDKIRDILAWTRDSSDILLNATTMNESSKAFKNFEWSLQHYEDRRNKTVSISSSKTRSCEVLLSNNSRTEEWNTTLVYEPIDEVNEWAAMCRSSNGTRESDAVEFAFTVMNQLRKAIFENDLWMILMNEVNKTTNISQIQDTVLEKLNYANETSNNQLIYLASMQEYIDNLKEAKDPEQRLSAVVAIENAKREYENLDKRVLMIRPENQASGGPIRHRWSYSHRVWPFNPEKKSHH